ncbi:MAG: alpha-amylase family glycosyl hydrolase, partial [Chloroflexota bacterium]
AILRAERVAGQTIWPNYVLGNHDIIRPATRFAEGFLGADRVHVAHLASDAKKEDDSRAKLLMTLLLTLRGTPFLYYGDEIGMREHFLPKREIMDPLGKVYWPLVKGRDGCRAPMQWDASPNAGFSSATPWNRVHPDYGTRNVAAQLSDPTSLLNLTRGLLRLRKTKPALVRGDFVPIAPQPRGRGALVYRRELAGHAPILVALNFTKRTLTVDASGNWIPLVGVNQVIVQERITLSGYEFCVLEQSI